MTVLATTRDARTGSPAGDRFAALLEHLSRRWPDAFVLAAACTPPEEHSVHPGRDWIRLPEDGLGDCDRLRCSARLLQTLSELHDAAVTLLSGPDAEALAELLPGAVLLPEDFTVDSADEVLATRLPLSIVLRDALGDRPLVVTNDLLESRDCSIQVLVTAPGAAQRQQLQQLCEQLALQGTPLAGWLLIDPALEA